MLLGFLGFFSDRFYLFFSFFVFFVKEMFFGIYGICEGERYASVVGKLWKATFGILMGAFFLVFNKHCTDLTRLALFLCSVSSFLILYVFGGLFFRVCWVKRIIFYES